MENTRKKMKPNESAEWCMGPDNLHPARSYTTSRLDEAVKLRLDNHPFRVDRMAVDFKPISIFSKFKNTVELGSDRIAMGRCLRGTKDAVFFKLSFQSQVTNQNGTVNRISYGDYWNLCLKAAKSFIKVRETFDYFRCTVYARFYCTHDAG
jgi:hypothetical protein